MNICGEFDGELNWLVVLDRADLEFRHCGLFLTRDTAQEPGRVLRARALETPVE